MSGPVTICLDDDSDVEAQPPQPPLPKREGKKRACSTDAVSIDLTDDADLPLPLPSGKARKQVPFGVPSHQVVVDLCDDDGLLETDSAGQDFNSLFQQSFDDVEIVGEKWATAPPPTSHSTAARSGRGVAATSDAGSSSTANPGGGGASAKIDTSGDEDFAARLQAQMDEDIQRDGQRSEQRAGEDEEFARTLQARRARARSVPPHRQRSRLRPPPLLSLPDPAPPRHQARTHDRTIARTPARASQARLNRDIEESKKRASEDILHEQRDRIRAWLKAQAAHLSVRDVYANPAAMPDGELYRRFKEAQEKAGDKSVRLVFHGTREDNIEDICRKGLDPSRRGANGQAHGPGEYFAENPSISVPYCAGGKKMIVFAVLMDKSGLTKRDGSGIVVVNKTEHQLPMFVITFEPSAQVYAGAAQAAMGLAGMVGGINGAAAQKRLAQLRAIMLGGGFPYGGGGRPPALPPRARPAPAAPRARAAPRKRRR